MSTELTPEQEKKVQERLRDEKFSAWAYILKIMKRHYGEEVYEIFVEEEQKEWILQQWSKKAEELRDNSIEALLKILWGTSEQKGGSHEYTVEETEERFQIRCTKCRGYEIAKRLEITEQMYYWACAGDKYIAEGFNPNIGFRRTKTLMEGDDCCDNFYYYKDKNK